MTEELPSILKSGKRMRLILAVSEGNREKRAASAFVEGLIAISDLSCEVLATAGLRIGARASC